MVVKCNSVNDDDDDDYYAADTDANAADDDDGLIDVKRGGRSQNATTAKVHQPPPLADTLLDPIKNSDDDDI